MFAGGFFSSRNRVLWRALLASLGCHVVLLLDIPKRLPMLFGASIGNETVAQHRVLARLNEPVQRSDAVPKATTGNPILAGQSEVRHDPSNPSARRVANLPRDRVHAAKNTSGAIRSLDTAPDAPSISEDVVQAYRLEIARRLKGRWRYPHLAREKAWEGSVELMVTYPNTLSRPLVHVAISSGYPLLDDAALNMVDEQLQLIPPPRHEDTRSVQISLRLNFQLDAGNH